MIAQDRVELAFLPTPLQPLDRLCAALGIGDGPRVWIKRDDQTGLATGGNKARKLEFLLAEAIAQGADTLITAGAIQSNHARQTAAAARARGLAVHLVLLEERTDDDYRFNGNLLLDELLGAVCHRIDPARTPPDQAMDQVAAQVVAAGGTPYVVPIGGSSPLGALGYAAAAEEILAGPVVPGLVVHASGSGGTQAGLVAGFATTGTEVLGFSVAAGAAELHERVLGLARQTAGLIDDRPISAEDVRVDDGFVGPAYGEPTPQMIEAVELTARTEGILLDPVYTGKAMAGLIAGLREQRFAAHRDVMFVHTGGSAGLFAYRSVFTTERAGADV